MNDIRYDTKRRLEPTRALQPLTRSLRAEIHDPLWFMGRQWQLGELQGEDAASPVEVEYTLRTHKIFPREGNTRLDPKEICAEALVESGADDWWTLGRRIRLGNAYVKKQQGSYDDYLLKDLPPPYNALNRRAWDGLALYRDDPVHPVFREVPKSGNDSWNNRSLTYAASFDAGPVTLFARNHDGGAVNWYAFDAEPKRDAAGKILSIRNFGSVSHRHAFLNRMQYPGAPLPRWWQIEDRTFDIGGMAPDRGHFASMLLLEIMSSHSDNWYNFPIDTENGCIATVEDVRVRNSFGETYKVDTPEEWSVFKTRGIPHDSILVLTRGMTPLLGSVLEEVGLGMDASAKKLWAIEHRIDGRDRPSTDSQETSKTIAHNKTDERIEYTYKVVVGLRPGTHPYVLNEEEKVLRYEQARLGDIEQNPPALMPLPAAELLQPKEGNHAFEVTALPSKGLRIQKRWKLCRKTDGSPFLWQEYQRESLIAPPASALRYDGFESTSSE